MTKSKTLWERTVNLDLNGGGNNLDIDVNYDAAKEAVEDMDKCLEKIYNKVVTELGGTLIIIADHGNCDMMWDENHNPVTSHTTNPVPCIITKEGIELKDGKLADIAPTMLTLLGLPIPEEMNGECLIK